MLGKLGILITILALVLLFFIVISLGAGAFSKGKIKPETKIEFFHLPSTKGIDRKKNAAAAVIAIAPKKKVKFTGSARSAVVIILNSVIVY